MLELLRKSGLPDGFSVQSQSIDSVLSWVHILMLILCVGWGTFFIYTLIRFRKRPNVPADSKGIKNHYSTYSEAAIVIFEIILLVGFSFPVWANRVENVPEPSNSQMIKVVAQQFKWNMRYPGEDGIFGRTSPDLIDDQGLNFIGLDKKDIYAEDDIIPTQGHMHLPINKDITVELTTRDVIHSFFIPLMRVKQDAIPGISIPFWFTPNKTGSWEIACAQLCGNSHYIMKGYVHVHTQKGFKSYMKALSLIQEIDDYDYTFEAETTLSKVIDSLKNNNEKKAEELALFALTQVEQAKLDKDSSDDEDNGDDWGDDW